MLRKIYPFDAENSFTNSFKLIFISEGYLISESALFTASCIEFINKLLETAPFNLTKINNNWLSIYSSFIPSANSGPSVNSIPTSNRTALESQVNTTTNLISINQTKLNAHIDSLTFNYSGSMLSVKDYVGKGGFNAGKAGTLFIVLLPNLYEDSAGAEFESVPGDDNYYFISTTQNGEWQQVIIRGLCKLIGLADEFELNGNDFQRPVGDEIIGLLSFPNIQYFSTPPSQLTSHLKWYTLFPLSQRSLPLTVHSKSTSLIDNSINNNLTYTSQPEIWEGAAGFRTQVYRSAHDCLLRRQTGNSILPLRKTKVSFCPACLNYLKYLIC